MTFWGELTDGTELLLGEPLEAQLLYDCDAPADQLKAVFPTEKLWDDLAVVRVFHQGQVSSTGQGLRVQGESEYNSPEMLFPYGYSSAAADGKQAVMLDGVCAGIAASLDGELSQGEVRLYSAGGAEILLKNTGEVVINGQSFPPKS